MPHPKVYNLTDHWFPDKIGGSCIYAYKLHRLLSELVAIETVTLIGKFTLNICGDGPYKDELVRLIQQQKIDGAVRLLGWVTEEDKCKLIRESDAVIIPSRCLEGFSLLALEANDGGRMMQS